MGASTPMAGMRMRVGGVGMVGWLVGWLVGVRVWVSVGVWVCRNVGVGGTLVTVGGGAVEGRGVGVGGKAVKRELT
jgi:hypothetical protein